MVNDITIIGGIISLFVLLGVLLPIIQADLNIQDTTDVNIDDFTSDIQQQAKSESDLTVWKVLISILSMFFWTFGLIPIWLDCLFIILRIILAVTIARNIWVGGGA